MLYDEALKTLDLLSRCTIEFGILEEDRETPMKAFSVNAKGEVVETQMSSRDAMYLTEYGSLYVPGKYLLQKAAYSVAPYVEKRLSEIATDALDGNINSEDAKRILEEMALAIQHMVRSYITSYPDKTNVLAKLTGGESEESRYICDLAGLSRKVRCAINFAN